LGKERTKGESKRRLDLPTVTTPQRVRIQATRRRTPMMIRPSKAMNSMVPHIVDNERNAILRSADGGGNGGGEWIVSTEEGV